MRLIFWRAEKNYELALAGVLAEGAKAAGIELIEKRTADYAGPEGDGALILGVVKREILWDHQAKGVPVIVIDKGYCRDRVPLNGGSVPAWWRMCWQDVHPTKYLMAIPRSPDRWLRMGLELKEPKAPAEHVVIIGSSAKFHQTMRITEPTAWAIQIVHEIHRLLPTTKVIYRPKPSWKYAVPVEGAVFDHGHKTTLAAALSGASCSVTYGSIGCVDSIVAGVPCIVLGNAVAAPISSNFLKDVTYAYWALRPAREQWAANLGYCNFTPAEIGDGTAFKILKEQMSYAV